MYSDSLRYSLKYNLDSIDFSHLVDGRMVFNNFFNQTGKTVDISRTKFMTTSFAKTDIKSELEVRFINMTDGKAFNLQSDDTKVNFT